MAQELTALWAEIANLTVDRLKLTIRGVNEQLHNNLRLSGAKADLVQRLQTEARTHFTSNDNAKFQILRTIIHNATFNLPATGAHPAYNPPPPPIASHYNNTASHQAQASNGYGGYQQRAPAPLPPPHFGPNGTGVPYGSEAGGTSTIKFRYSPFWRVDKVLSPMGTLVKAGQGDRKSVVVQFMLSPPQITLLVASKAAPTNPQYQVRLFSTSEDYFNVAHPSENMHAIGAPVDFPPTCEIKLNATNVVANTKGIKKQVGTAPPVDLSRGPALDLGAGRTNKVEIIYVNTDKRYFIAVHLVEVTSVKQVVDKIKKGKYRAKDDVIASIVKMNSDPDVVATAYGLSLKDPLTFARIKTPIRSSTCHHIACFDAEVFFMMNEQTPAWACPICSKTLNVADISVDGYFDNILSATSSSVEQVIVEPDGMWRLEKPSTDSKPGSTSNSQNPSRSSSTLATANGKGKGRASEALTIDSDEDDEDDQPLYHRKASGSGTVLSVGSSEPDAAAQQQRGTKRPAEVIDLTGDSDDDEPPPPARTAPPVRKAIAPPLPPPPAGGAAYNQEAYRASLLAAQQKRQDQAAINNKKRRMDSEGSLY